MNFVMLPKYYIGKILPIYSILAIFVHKRRYASFCTECSETQVATLSLINQCKFSTVLYNMQPTDYVK